MFYLDVYGNIQEILTIYSQVFPNSKRNVYKCKYEFFGFTMMRDLFALLTIILPELFLQSSNLGMVSASKLY